MLAPRPPSWTFARYYFCKHSSITFGYLQALYLMRLLMLVSMRIFRILSVAYIRLLPF